MRDVVAEQEGDINRGQTHRLNRLAVGGSVQAPGVRPFHVQPFTPGNAFTPSSVPRPTGPASRTGLPADARFRGNLNAALALNASFGKTQYRGKGRGAVVSADAEFHARPSRFAPGHAGNFAAAKSFQANLKMEKVLAGPTIPHPRGARKGYANQGGNAQPSSTNKGRYQPQGSKNVPL